MEDLLLSSLNPPNAFGLEFRVGSHGHSPTDEQETMSILSICPVNESIPKTGRDANFGSPEDSTGFAKIRY
jgi:hypothetical protein